MVLINAVTLSQGYNIYLKNKKSDDDWTDKAIVNYSILVDIPNLVLHFFSVPYKKMTEFYY